MTVVPASIGAEFGDNGATYGSGGTVVSTGVDPGQANNAVAQLSDGTPVVLSLQNSGSTMVAPLTVTVLPGRTTAGKVVLTPTGTGMGGAQDGYYASLTVDDADNIYVWSNATYRLYTFKKGSGYSWTQSSCFCSTNGDATGTYVATGLPSSSTSSGSPTKMTFVRTSGGVGYLITCPGGTGNFSYIYAIPTAGLLSATPSCVPVSTGVMCYAGFVVDRANTYSGICRTSTTTYAPFSISDAGAITLGANVTGANLGGSYMFPTHCYAPGRYIRYYSSNATTLWIWTYSATGILTNNPTSASVVTSDFYAYSLVPNPIAAGEVFIIGAPFNTRSDGYITCLGVSVSDTATSITSTLRIAADSYVAAVAAKPGVSTYVDVILGTNQFVGSPYSTGVQNDRFRVVSLNYQGPPSAPSGLSPAAGGYIASTTGTFGWTYNPVATQNTQTAWEMRRKIGAGAYSYWNAGTSTWQSTEVWNSSAATSVTVSGWTIGTTYAWSVRSRDQGGDGAWAPDQNVTPNRPPTLTLTGPGATVGSSRVTAAWTYADADSDPQTAWQTAIFNPATVAASGFDPATSPALDTGSGTGTTASWTSGVDLPNGATGSVYVRVGQSSPVGTWWSTWASQAFTVSISPPTAPTLVCTPSAAAATVSVTVTIPGSPPSPTVDVQRSADGGLTWQAVQGGTAATPTGATLSLVDSQSPGGTVQYRARVVTHQGVNVIPSSWTTVTASTGVTGWVLRDLAGDGLLLVCSQTDETWDTKATEAQAYKQPLGRRLGVTVSDAGATGPETGTLSPGFRSEADWQTFETLRQRQTVLHLTSPYGDRWWVRLGAERAVSWPLGTAKKLRTVTVPWTEANPPAGWTV